MFCLLFLAVGCLIYLFMSNQRKPTRPLHLGGGAGKAGAWGGAPAGARELGWVFTGKPMGLGGFKDKKRRNKLCVFLVGGESPLWSWYVGNSPRRKDHEGNQKQTARFVYRETKRETKRATKRKTQGFLGGLHQHLSQSSLAVPVAIARLLSPLFKSSSEFQFQSGAMAPPSFQI